MSEDITFNLVCFLDNVDFARDFVKYLPSRDFARLSIVHREFNPMHIIKQDYKELYLAFIRQREKYYPLIFSFHFKSDTADTLSELLADETIANLISNKPMTYIPDQMREFNVHGQKIREILYQCFSLYLSKPIQIVGKDGEISFDEVGSVLYRRDIIIDKNGKWADSFKDGVYSNEYSDIDRYNDYGDLNPLGIYDEDGSYIYDEIYNFYINSLFVLLHKFDIKLKNKLIVDKIAISPFEQEIWIIDLPNILVHNILYPHYVNNFYKGIEINLDLIKNIDFNKFYSFIAAISTGYEGEYEYRNEKIEEDSFDRTHPVIHRYLMGTDINKYRDMVTTSEVSPNNAEINELVDNYINSREDLDLYLQPHLKTKKYDTAHLLDYIDISFL